MYRFIFHSLLLQFLYMKCVLVADVTLPSAEDKNSYGPYSLNVTRLISCDDESWDQRPFSYSRGSVSEVYTSVFRNTLIANMTMFKTCDLAKAKSKVTISFVKDNVKKIFLSYGVKNTCQHFAVGSSLKTILKLKDCMIRKGQYFVKVNMTENTLLFTGPSFFYGEFEYKSWVRCKTELFFCLVTSVVYAKKN